ncbi:flagellar assembly protein FliW [Frondihabitans cladoniiphilus]|uniref:Flagellar assembly factor FliW n=1 Tax=Frondihabitans cladoniiphilus TaxID=715785 RepID=A0ABP8VWC8_9MICO
MTAQLSFVTPPPGLDPVVDFTLDAIDGAPGLYSLHASEAPTTRLFVVDAAVHLPHYSPFVTDEQAGMLGLTSAEQALLLVIANPAETGTTVNLMAPIVVNLATGISAQLILEDQEWPLRAALVPGGAVASGASAAAAVSASASVRTREAVAV